MGIFDNFEMVDDLIVNNSWIEWNHFGIPNEAGILRETIRTLMLIFGHCLVCTKLDGCYFVERNMPNQPQHNNCDCTTLTISRDQVKHKAISECDIRKFEEYIFKGIGGKKELFESWGYSIIDSENLVREFTRQAKLKYQCGEYSLGNLDAYGQRISIIITLPKKNGMGEVSFVSGWMVYPNGEIVLTTPYGGK